MKTIYIDSNFRCHIVNDGTMTLVETDVFDAMPNPVIECYRFVPNGHSHTKPNGVTVRGEFIQPFVTEKELDAAQREYEQQLLTEYSEALQLLGVDLNDN